MVFNEIIYQQEVFGSEMLDSCIKNRHLLPKNKNTLLARNLEMMLKENLFLTDDEIKIYRNVIVPKLLKMLQEDNLAKHYIEDCISARKIQDSTNNRIKCRIQEKKVVSFE